MTREDITNIIKSSLWGKSAVTINQSVFDEMKQHSIAALFGPCLSTARISPELKDQLKYYLLQQISYYTKYIYEQGQLPLSIPYVILKGTSAAQYYPHPEYRTMGDIDIMTRREDFSIACQQLKESGYQVIEELNREISFKKNGIIIELHQRFATLNDPSQAKYFDDLIIQNITPSHILPDLVNGLVLLEHLDQHMEGGIGFRQIIDWMMFVHRCLPDDRWYEFKELSDNTGLTKLAVTVTRMCEMHLGLSQHQWCANADKELCEQLLDYIFSCGNFGKKKNIEANIGVNAFAYASTPKMMFRLLQKQGLTHWKAAQRHKTLRPFAWLYQANRYVIKGLNRKKAVSKIIGEYSTARKRNEMFDALGVKTDAKGILVYKDGEYVKK